MENKVIAFKAMLQIKNSVKRKTIEQPANQVKYDHDFEI